MLFNVSSTKSKDILLPNVAIVLCTLYKHNNNFLLLLEDLEILNIYKQDGKSVDYYGRVNNDTINCKKANKLTILNF
jgi:hypothetical protein